jgi:hypothetical protein
LDYVLKKEPFLEKWTSEYGSDASLPNRLVTRRITVSNPMEDSALASIRPGGGRLSSQVKTDDIALRSTVSIIPQDSAVQGMVLVGNKLQVLRQTKAQHIIGDEYQAITAGEATGCSLSAGLSTQIIDARSPFVDISRARSQLSRKE